MHESGKREEHDEKRANRDEHDEHACQRMPFLSHVSLKNSLHARSFHDMAIIANSILSTRTHLASHDGEDSPHCKKREAPDE